MKTFLFLFLAFLSVQVAQATHLIGGYIQVKPVAGSGLTYEVIATIYSYAGSATSEASSLSICFGDGNTREVPRSSLLYVTLGSNTISSKIGINTYRINHTYSGPGTYTLTTSLANRTPALNIPNSSTQQEPLALTTTFITGSLSNQTPELASPTIGFSVGLGQKTTLAFRATDADGDSLAYGLVKPLTNTTTDFCSYRSMTAYQFPNDVTHQGTYKLNNRTGDLTWDAPTQQGNYSVVISVSEYRNGILISQTIQEIALIVTDQPGTPNTIPAYEPAIEGNGIVTALPNYLDSDFTLTTFPSPVDDQLQVIVQTSTLTNATIQLVDVGGRKLYESDSAKSARQHEQVISMGSLTPGVYIIRAVTGNRSLSRKIVKR
ncbi:T9SS type A sorting domain-containing protein [Spirosoma foliorum]|uniref:T9SS type A sorting domain-containing protein n=1 Tax=Spirosoma foliorum TaxID=2710596 RepID=A0A7G5GWZ5_9BACT|nr:T9SS type A sorting domain-containing protein [Spirosoma foliorum]QMW03387.1 T9SS type A sorting domain-containing protein [Spirosoma foliorum]QMW03420.1 T9SS type A sorting domain-containing protein [Spirosoma foliorum]